MNKIGSIKTYTAGGYRITAKRIFIHPHTGWEIVDIKKVK